MKGALWILAATVLTGLVLYLVYGRRANPADDIVADTPSDDTVSDRPEGCCGLHLVCEKGSVVSVTDKQALYYADEELDRYSGIAADGYTPEQIDEFRDVLYTLRPEEIAGWAKSIEIRGITLPSTVYQEMLSLVAEARQNMHNREVQAVS